MIHRLNIVQKQIPAYERLVGLFNFLRVGKLSPSIKEQSNQFARLRELRVRIGTMDLKIAARALANGAMLLSANLRDFQRVPGLHVENWLGPNSRFSGLGWSQASRELSCR